MSVQVAFALPHHGDPPTAPGLGIPVVDGVTYETWDLPNPHGWDANAIRPLREHISARIGDLPARFAGES